MPLRCRRVVAANCQLVMELYWREAAAVCRRNSVRTERYSDNSARAYRFPTQRRGAELPTLYGIDGWFRERCDLSNRQCILYSAAFAESHFQHNRSDSDAQRGIRNICRRNYVCRLKVLRRPAHSHAPCQRNAANQSNRSGSAKYSKWRSPGAGHRFRELYLTLPAGTNLAVKFQDHAGLRSSVQPWEAGPKPARLGRRIDPSNSLLRLIRNGTSLLGRRC